MDEAKTGRNRLSGRFGGRAGKGLAGAAFLWVAKWAVVVAFVFAGCGPIGPIPGGALDGEAGPAVVATGPSRTTSRTPSSRRARTTRTR